MTITETAPERDIDPARWPDVVPFRHSRCGPLSPGASSGTRLRGCRCASWSPAVAVTAAAPALTRS